MVGGWRWAPKGAMYGAYREPCGGGSGRIPTGRGSRGRSKGIIEGESSGYDGADFGDMYPGPQEPAGAG